MRPNRSLFPSAARAEAGFTLIELLVSLAVTTVLILGVLATFDFSARMNRVQLNMADMQQGLRIAQNEVVKLARMTGRGSLPAAVALQVVNNVPAGTKLVASSTKTEIAEGTDLLRLRGVFSSSLYQIEWQDPSIWVAPDADGNGSVLVKPLAAGVPQDLTTLRKAIKKAVEEKGNEALLLVTPFDVHAVAQVVVEAAMVGPNLQVWFTRNPNAAALSGPLPAGMPAPAFIGILEEYVFYVRRFGTGNAPSLTKARMEPGTSLPYNGENDALLDLADNIYDMQVAPGLGVVGAPELRVSTLVRTDRADPGNYRAPDLPLLLEDHAYPSNHPFNTAAQRRYRWRTMTTTLNLRNL